MAALDDILNNGGMPTTARPKPVRVSPPPVDGQLAGANNTVGSQPATPPPSTQRKVEQAPGTDGEKPQEQRQGQTGEKKRLSYVEMFEALNPNKPETAEERAKREKREKSEAILSAVGDGISALSNLFFTTHYAPNAYDASKGMSAKAKERWDRLRMERETNRRAYSDGYLRALAMDEAGDREDRNWRHTLEREKIADERYEIKDAHDKAMADLDEKLRRHQITAAEHKAEQERIAAQFAEETERLKQENLRAGVRQKDAAAGASHSRARYYDNGGGKPTLQLEDDEPMRFGDGRDYDRAVMRLAPDYGVPTTEVQVTERDNDGKPKKPRTVQRPVKDIAADIEREAAKRQKAKGYSDKPSKEGGLGLGSNNKGSGKLSGLGL